MAEPTAVGENGLVRTVARLDTDVTAPTLFEAVSSLDGYDRWLEIVTRVVRDEVSDGDPGPAWQVDLRGQVGPLRRSKRLRMVRTVHDAPSGGSDGEVRYERRELDGRNHSPWTLVASVSHGSDDCSHLEMTLEYGGTLWVPLVERMLSDEIERSRPRLLAHLHEV